MVRQKIIDKRASRFRKRIRPRAPMLNRYINRDIDPILEILHQNDYSETIKTTLRKYLLITSVSLIEEVLMRLFARTIDDNKINISIFGNDKAKSYTSSSKLSKGEHIASHYYFGTPQVIDNAFSKLLKTNSDFVAQNMTFLEAIKKSDSCDVFRNYKKYKTKPLYKNWDSFINMFETRNKLIHGMSRVKLSNAKVATFCDNTISFLDIAIALCMMNNAIFEIL
jgi:hypothetical protein